MKVYQGASQVENARTAVDEATREWRDKENQFDFVLVFHSTRQDGSQVAAALNELFPGATIAGCSTAGEHLAGQHFNGGLVVCGVKSPKTRWKAAMLENIQAATQKEADELAKELLQALNINSNELNPKRHFALTFMDGMSLKEESVVSLMVESLEGIPFLGGSAGDDLKFASTTVIANGKVASNAAVFVLVESEENFEILKHQHFTKSAISLVMTEVDEATRKVITIDGLPAAERYAQVLGKKIDELGPEVFSLYPLTFETNNQLYVRSVQSSNPDGSLSFYCAIEEGMVLDIGGHHDMEKALANDLQALKSRFKRVDFFLMCNCILRALEATASNKHEGLGKILTSVTGNIIGFDTYGEQLNGLHINQTLVGLAIGEAA